MTGKTYPELTSAADVEDTDLVALYRAPGPLKRVAASVFSLFAKKELPIYAADYGVAPANADNSAAFGDVVALMVLTGREIVLPPGVLRFNTQTDVFLNDQLTYKAAFRKGIRISGAGTGRTIIDSRVANGWWLNISVGNGSGGENAFASFAGILGGYLRGVTIRNGAATANSGGVQVRAQYQFPFNDIHIVGLSGTGIKTRCVFGDTDANNQVSWTDVRVEDCLGWGTDAGTDFGPPLTYPKTITGATQAAQCVVTAVAHGFANQTVIFMTGVAGMTQLNGIPYLVLNATANTFEIAALDIARTPVNSTAFGAYTSGGTAGVAAGHNENSFTAFERCFWQNNGTASQKTITGITQANPGVVTATAHGFTNGLKVFIEGVNGMDAVRSSVAARSYAVTVVDANSFSIGVDTSGFGAWTSGGHAFPTVATSGGLRLKGQIGELNNCGFTINKNRSVYVDGDGGGLPQDLAFNNSTIENPQLIGVHIKGCRTINSDVLHVYTNADAGAGPQYWGHLYDGEENLVAEVNMRGLCVRTTAASGEAHLTVFQAIGSNVALGSVRHDAQSMHVKQFGFPGQVMFRNLTFEPVNFTCETIVTSAIEVRVRPRNTYGAGDKMPMRQSYGGSAGSPYSSGAVVWVPIPALGIAINNAGLANNTVYFVYIYPRQTAIQDPLLELSTTVPTSDANSGFMIKTGDPTRVWTGARVQTDGSAQFVTAAGSWLNPLVVPSGQPGLPAYQWVSAVDRKLRHRNASTLPSSIIDADYEYWPTVETNVTYTIPELLTGASTTVDVAVTATNFPKAVSFIVGGVIGFGDRDVTYTIKTATLVRVRITNNTGGTIPTTAAGTIRVLDQTR